MSGIVLCRCGVDYAALYAIAKPTILAAINYDGGVEAWAKAEVSAAAP